MWLTAAGIVSHFISFSPSIEQIIAMSKTEGTQKNQGTTVHGKSRYHPKYMETIIHIT